jgi:hypothetical protein
MIDRQIGPVVIGGSQAGFAVGYFLKQRDRPFVILDENDRIGDPGGSGGIRCVCLRRAATTDCHIVVAGSR